MFPITHILVLSEPGFVRGQLRAAFAGGFWSHAGRPMKAQSSRARS